MPTTLPTPPSGAFVLRELRPHNLPQLIRLYNHHLIPDRVLWDLASGKEAFGTTDFCGMVNHSATRGLLATGTPAPSLEEEWREWLTRPQGEGMVYRGKLLHPAPRGLPAAFVTWWEPAEPWADSTTAYLDHVRGIITTIHFHNEADRDWLLEIAPRVVLGDTICGPRWSRHLCLDAVREWLSSGFRFALIYRHMRLTAWMSGCPEPVSHLPVFGKNVRSERALHAQGYRDIGTRPSDLVAVRCDGRVRVRPEEGWMVADLAESLPLLEAHAR